MKIVITGIRTNFCRDIAESENIQLTDITIGKQYKVKRNKDDGEAYILDDKGDRNYVLGQEGIAEFYIVNKDVS